MKKESFLYLFFGPNGAGKTTLSKEFCLRERAMHIELDIFSYMQRGRAWYTRRNSFEKMRLLIATLNEALRCGRNKFSVEGVLIYPFMFRMLEDWCLTNHIRFIPVKVVGSVSALDFRVTRRIKLKQDWNSKLPDFYRGFHYRGQVCLDTSNLSVSECVEQILEKSENPHESTDSIWHSVSFGMLKPDCTRRCLRIESMRRIEGRGLSIVLERQTFLNDQDIFVLYGHLSERHFFSEMAAFLKSGEVSLFLVKGRDAIKTLNSVVGFTDPKLAKVNTLRNLGTSVTENIAHSADSVSVVIQSSLHFFPQHDLHKLGLTVEKAFP